MTVSQARQCKAISKRTGKRCRQPAMKDADYCRFHESDRIGNGDDERRAYSWPMLPGERRKRFDGHSVNARSPRIGLDSSPGRVQILRGQNLLHHGLLLNTPILPNVEALAALRPYGRGLRGIRHAVGAFLFGSALSGDGRAARSPVLWPLLTPHRVTPAGSPQVRTRCFPDATAAFTCATEPYGFAVLCQLAASRRPYYAVLVHRPAGFP